MKKVFLAFIFIPITIYSQSIEERLQGTWLSIKVTDSLGKGVNGVFGGSRNFLKFHFEKKKLFIALAPFDKGTANKIKYGPDYFELVNAPLSQPKYIVKLLSTEGLILETTDASKKIYYQFVNINKYRRNLDQVSNVRSYEELIIEMRFERAVFGYAINSYYRIDNSVLNLLPCPLFSDPQYFSLGAYLESTLRISLRQMKDLNDKATIFEFDVTDRGIENITIVEKLGEEIDFQIYDWIRGMHEKWKPLVVDGETYHTRIRLKILFLYQEG